MMFAIDFDIKFVMKKICPVTWRRGKIPDGGVALIQGKEIFSSDFLITFLISTQSCPRLGKDGVSKTDEFLEKFQKGGGSFPIQKFILQILDLK